MPPLVDPASAGPLSGFTQCWSPLWIQPVLVLFVDSASAGHLCGSSQRVSHFMWIQPLLVLFVYPASAGPLSRSSHPLGTQSPFVDPASAISLVHPANAGPLCASSQCWSPKWIEPAIVPFIDPASVVFLVHPASTGHLFVCSRCWSPHSVYAASAGPLVDPASDCPLYGSSHRSLMLY